jgi:hypothetical protein
MRSLLVEFYHGPDVSWMAKRHKHWRSEMSTSIYGSAITSALLRALVGNRIPVRARWRRLQKMPSS